MSSPPFDPDRPNGLNDIRQRLWSDESVGFADGSRFVSTHPHPVYTRVTSAGYTLQYRTELGVGEHRLVVRAVTGGVPVATVTFSRQVGGTSLRRETVDVHPDHRRRGLSTALYLFAELVSGMRLEGFWGDNSE